MEQKIWLLTWYGDDYTVAFEKLEDAKGHALKLVRESHIDEEEYQTLVKELNESYDEYRGFFVESWFWCDAIKLYR